MPQRKNIAITTFGSLGDLHPAIALGLELARRGHQVTVASSATHGAKVLERGLGFHALRPDVAPGPNMGALAERVMHPRHGPRTVFKEILFPAVADTYADLLPLARQVDVLVSSETCFASPLVAQQLQLPFISYVLAPLSIFSAYDMPLVSQAPWLRLLRHVAPAGPRALLWAARSTVSPWARPLAELRRNLGLQTASDPLFKDKHSPQLALAMFSRVLQVPQPDWPRQMVQTGFPFLDEAESPLPPELQAFLAAGQPPVVFTLGSSAVHAPGEFYRTSAAAVQRLGRRAVFLAGGDASTLPPLSPDIAVAGYVPHAPVFAQAAAIVHHGGVGTTAQALRAGKPMLVLPFSFDQPDNAARVARLGVGCAIGQRRYTAARVAATLRAMLSDQHMRQRAEVIGRRVREENGTARAADVIEATFGWGSGNAQEP